MLNLGELVNTVQRNCDISDARHAGDYSLCTFLLKMREFYRWEHDIPLSAALSQSEIGRWLEERERLWDDLEATPFEPLPLESGRRDPFESEAVNAELLPYGYVYSGGYGRNCKPHFFLGELAHREVRDGFTVLVSSCEYARDLTAPPAMLQGRTIYVRQESVRRFLWERIEEAGWNPGNEAMARALACYGLARDVDRALERMTHNETEAMILHELGETKAGELLGEDWPRMVTDLARTRAELMARAVRDILADLLATLPGLLAGQNRPSLHFYFGNFTGMRRQLYPELVEAYREAVATENLAPLARRVAQDVERWRRLAQSMLNAYRADRANAVRAVEALLPLEPA